MLASDRFVDELYITLPPYKLTEGGGNDVWRFAFRLNGRRYSAHLQFWDGKPRIGSMFHGRATKLKSTGEVYCRAHYVLSMALRDLTEARAEAIALKDWIDKNFISVPGAA
jgi:hypothetical protein